MPNWCEGSIRFRGKKKDITNFLLNEVVCVIYNKETSEYTEVKPESETKDWFVYLHTVPECDSFYFRNTHRNFIFNLSIEIEWRMDEEDEEEVAFVDFFNSAWSFKSQGWVEHAMNYNIDIRMIGFERGMQFSQTMTIYRDGTVEDKSEEYADWYWECPCPELGG